jgi:phosphoglycerate dehydrogenase-like enzyme
MNLQEADIVVTCLSLSKETAGIVGIVAATFVSFMKKGVIVGEHCKRRHSGLRCGV